MVFIYMKQTTGEFPQYDDEPAKTAVSPYSSPQGTFREKERLGLSVSGIRSGALIGRRSSYIVLGIVYEWQTKDKRLQRSNVNATNL